MGELEIDIAIKAFEENRANTDHKDGYQYNLAVGLLALARAVKELQQQEKDDSGLKPGFAAKNAPLREP
jgi:hypothetical protein